MVATGRPRPERGQAPVSGARGTIAGLGQLARAGQKRGDSPLTRKIIFFFIFSNPNLLTVSNFKFEVENDIFKT
jgi:hypothetical protein